MTTLIVDDFIMLGCTFPQKTTNHGITVCACGYSFSMRQLLRIYPLQLTDNIPKYSIVSMELERPRNDTRYESWKVKKYSVNGKLKEENVYKMLEKIIKPSIKCLNEQRASLGVLLPKSITFELLENKHDLADNNFGSQLNLFSNNDIYVPTHIPYLKIRNKDYTTNNLQFREHIIYEHLRNNNEPQLLYDVIKFNNDSFQHLLVVGNMKQHRNVWLVISVISAEKEENKQIIENITNKQLSLQLSI